MSWKINVICASLSLGVLSQAGLIQQPLLLNGIDAPLQRSLALTKLRDEVDERLIEASPIGKPCYFKPGPLDLDACNIAKKFKKDDAWVSGQPGGYYYVRAP